MSEVTREIALDQLVPRKGNRQVGGMPKESIQELAASIAEKGILQPLIVRPLVDDGTDSSSERAEVYEIVAGGRRSKAAAIVGMVSAPCFVREMSDEEAEQVALIDNLQRAELHPMDEAACYAAIQTQVLRGPAEKDPVGVVAARVGKPARYVLQRMQLVHLTAAAQALWRKKEQMTLGHALLLCRLPSNVQDRIVKTLGGHEEWVLGRGLRAFADWIQRDVYMELARAPWKMDDAQLLPGAGACTTCPKRTGANAALFPEVGKADTCLDAGCFAKKAEAFLQKKRAELKGQPHLLVSRESYYTRNKEGTLGSSEWGPAKKGEKDAVQCLVMDGKDAGKVVWGRKWNNQSGRYQASAREKAATAKRNAEEKLKKTVGLAVYRAVVAVAAEETTGHQTGIPLDVLRMLAREAFGRQYERAELAKIESWPYKAWSDGQKLFTEMGEAELLLVMLKCLLIGRVHSYDNRELAAIAKAYRVDVASIQKQVRAELAAKAKPAKKAGKKAASKAGKKASAC